MTGGVRWSPCALWVTAGLRFGDDDRADGATMAAWCDTVGDGDLVFVLGALGDPDFVDGLPGRVHLLAGPGDPMSPWDLPVDLRSRRQAYGVRDAAEQERQRLVDDWRSRGDLTYVWTGVGQRWDPHRSTLHPSVVASLVVRGRTLTATGLVGDTSVAVDPTAPRLHRLEDL